MADDWPCRCGRGRGRGFGLVACALFFSLTKPPTLQAQSGSGFQVSAGAHALTVPWYLGPMKGGFNHAVMVAADRPWKSGDRWGISVGVSFGFVRDRWWMTGLSLEPELRFGGVLPGGFHADLGLGLGYMHYFWRRKTLELRDGAYVKAASWGRPSLTVPLSATVGYRGNPGRLLVVSPFVSARWTVQALFLDETPGMTHLSLLGGMRIQRVDRNRGR